MNQDERVIMANYKLLKEGRIEEVLLKKTRKGVDMYVTSRRELSEGEHKKTERV
jgi:hypothetical protein